MLYEAADPYSRKVFIDRGLSQGVLLGSPVINEAGVLGQVTHAYPLTSEVTLLADKDAAIPVLNTRTQQRGAAFGGGPAAWNCASWSPTPTSRWATCCRPRAGRRLPAGPASGQVSGVERRVESGFARIVLRPAATPTACARCWCCSR